MEALLRDRLASAPVGSYSVTLLRDPELAQRKVMEEAFELCQELGRAEPRADRIAAEAADLLFHTLAALVGAGVPLEAVLAELSSRRSSTNEP